MAIAMQRFCINRKIAPALSIEAFFRLVNRLGLNKVELRNDLPSGKVTDDLSHQQVRELAARYHIEILTINAVYPFNRRSEEVRQLTESLLKEAQAIGAKSLVLCPLNDGSEVPASETLSALRDLAPLFAFYGIHGPKGLSPAVVERISQAVKKTLEDPAVKKRIEDTGSLVVGNTPQEFAAQTKAEFELYKGVVAKQKLKLE